MPDIFFLIQENETFIKNTRNMNTTHAYNKIKQYGAFLEETCVSITREHWNELMNGATRANKKIVFKIAHMAGLIDDAELKKMLRYKNYNPYDQYKTKSHIVYVHSGIEHFIKF